jgi:hypothetical protein
MKLSFVSPLLHELDALEAETLVCSVWQDVRPNDGVAALCDWRFSGRLSKLMTTGFLTGAFGEVLLVPGRPRISFEKILLFGAGARAEFNEQRFVQVLDKMLSSLEGLACKSSVLQLPGRQGDLISAERATDLLLQAVTAANARHGSFSLVEDHEARRRIEQHMIEERRRVRPVP